MGVYSNYKFIHYYEAPEEFEMYDLQEDPGELHNLYGKPRRGFRARGKNKGLYRSSSGRHCWR
jgi:arylsulfatase A-like enzyme